MLRRGASDWRQRLFSWLFNFSNRWAICPSPNPRCFLEANSRHHHIILSLYLSVSLKIDSFLKHNYPFTHTPQFIISDVHSVFNSPVFSPVISFVCFLITGLLELESKVLLIHRFFYRRFIFFNTVWILFMF